MKKIKKIHRLDVLKVCWYRTCRPRITNVYPLFKAFCLQKYHVQDAQNCITCLRIKASKSLPLCCHQTELDRKPQSALRMYCVDLRKNCLQPALKTPRDVAYAAGQYIGRLFQRIVIPEKLFFFNICLEQRNSEFAVGVS